MALEARGFSRPGRRTLLWSPADSRGRRSRAGRWWSGSSRSSSRACRLSCREPRAAGRRLPVRRRDVVRAARRRPRAARRRRRRCGRRVRVRQDDALPGRSAGWRRGRSAATSAAGHPRTARTSIPGRCISSPHGSGSASRTQGPSCRRCADSGLRGGRLRTDEPRTAARRGHRAHVEGARDPAHRRPRRARSAASLGRAAAARRDRRTARDAPASTSSSTSRPPSSIRPARAWWATRSRRLAADGASILVAEQKTDLLAAVCARARRARRRAGSRSGGRPRCSPIERSPAWACGALRRP